MYKVHVKRTIVVAVLGVLVGVAVYVLTPKVYEARLEMLLGTNVNPSRSQINVISPDVQEIIERNSPKGLLTERQLLSSQTVFYAALTSAAPDLLEDWEDYYLMFDVVTARTPNQAEQGAGVAQIRVRTHDARVSERVADAIAVSYNTERRNAAVAANNDAVSYLDSQIEASRQAVADAEQDYEDYKKEIGIAMISKTMMVETDFRAALVSSLESARARLEGTEARIDSLDRQIAELPATVLDLRNDMRSPEVQLVEAEIVALEGVRAIESAKYTGVNPKIKVLNASIADARARLAIAEQDPMTLNSNVTRKSPRRSTLELELSLAEAGRADLIATIASFQMSLVEQDMVLAGTPAKEVMIAKLDRDRQVFVEKYRRLKTQLEELQNRSETGLKAAVVLGGSGARAMINPVAPNFVKLAFIGLIAGAAVGLVMSFSLESMRPRVYTSAQLADLTGLPVVASIPILPGLSRSRAVESLASRGAGAMETFRNMAYSYLATRPDGNRTIMFTGIGTAGSSSIGAAEFAVALAQAGTKVVLVDAERTRQVITNGFAANDMKGISDAFQSGAGVVAMLVGTQHENLRLLPIGTVPEAMMSEGGLGRVDETIAALRSEAEVVIIAVAPTDIVADAAAFASRVDEVCLSVSARTNEYGAVPTAFDILEKAGAKSIKLILTDTGRDGEPFAAGTSIQRASWR